MAGVYDGELMTIPGWSQYSDTYMSSLLPMMAAKGIPLSIAVVTGGSYSQSIAGEVQGWIDAGWDINSALDLA